MKHTTVQSFICASVDHTMPAATFAGLNATKCNWTVADRKLDKSM